ncbi:NADH-ubiquinone oxidoreductase subunit [Exidia glandulosa HHB12029]|uniref:NADH-ubiquinone oxidoreductase n=1 Tax=Exidia glandulosa HHB12029 TaxID=1314781 RepID=A0A165L317_EXIGL|nr:NADH-ubiquinone oxidoreductase subunit [Exidia glandulosa HHB12029]
MSGRTYVDNAPVPSDVPHVDEVGVTSAPLKSAAFFIGKFCQAYNDDFMQCKADARDPAACLKEGRRVTRCATELINKLRENCQQEWDKHWDCLEQRNQEFYRCRKAESALNACVLEKLGIKKEIPNSKIQVHTIAKPVFKDDTPKWDRP